MVNGWQPTSQSENVVCNLKLKLCHWYNIIHVRYNRPIRLNVMSSFDCLIVCHYIWPHRSFFLAHDDDMSKNCCVELIIAIERRELRLVLIFWFLVVDWIYCLLIADSEMCPYAHMWMRMCVRVNENKSTRRSKRNQLIPLSRVTS